MGLSGGALLFAAAAPALKAFLLTATGAALANPRINVLKPRMLRDFNTLIVSLFIPSLVFLNICSAVSARSIKNLWPLPLNVILQVLIGRILGGLVALVFRPPLEYRPIIFGAVAMGNLGNLPLTLVDTFCTNSPSDEFGGDDCSRVGQGYVALGIIPAVVLQWTWLYDITSPRDENARPQISESPTRPETLAAERMTLLENLDDGAEAKIEADEDHSQEITIERSAIAACEQAGSDGKVIIETFELEITPTAGPQRSFYKSGSIANFVSMPRISSLAQLLSAWPSRPDLLFLRDRLKRVLTPPCICAFLAIVIGLIPPVKWVVLDDHSPLRILRQTVEGFGNCTIPSIMLLLGAKLSKGPGSGTKNMGLSVVWATVIARLVILPAIGMLLVRAYVLFGFLPKDDRLQQLVLHTQHAMPTAVNMVAILTIHNYGEEELSAIVFWEYCLCVFTISFWFFLFLHF